MPVEPSWIHRASASGCVFAYNVVRDLLCPTPLRGKVISTVLAFGNFSYCVVSVVLGSKVKGMVLLWPLRVVAA